MLKSGGGMLYKPYREYNRSRSPRPPAGSSDRDMSLATSSIVSASRTGTNENTFKFPADNQKSGDGQMRSLVTAGNMAGATLKSLANLPVLTSKA
ncbi:uncharacterized protein BP01DRAFT_359571 [Aspergillus saccharolyticus JOP 1030-1]|uniref:Uncharacterized protein n=1 Tax=Aspergillus saccharolyticus JOP 1030-1 TaxID=1450539 RepID=A0A318Z7E2_9EURO|nr:hypothetical protein BP01DRAFT_359571 [Aspergillus saccharolyticus JOP 1030-1]PYH42317.1 hypothetical protein BP01DRAFT_359571 [Aspergillus saccharolyticus JOP 1030-1]